jgi:hypothetical protein
MRNLIISLCFLSIISIPAAANNYPGKDYVCNRCTARDNFVDFMWAGLTRLEFTNGFYVFVFSEFYGDVVRVAIRTEGSKYFIDRSGTVIGKFISYGPVDLATITWLKNQARQDYPVTLKPKPGRECLK